MAAFNGSGLGWVFNAELDDATGTPPDSGLALQDVRHDAHNFARDIRAIGAWINTQRVDASGKVLDKKQTLVTLDSKLFSVSAMRTLIPRPIARKTPVATVFQYLQEVDSALSFSDYFKDGQGNYVAYGLAVNYDAPDLFASLHLDNCEYAGLSINLQYLFSRYANDPPHEPSGQLSAARFHPLITYQLTPNPVPPDKNKPRTRLTSIRFDMRLYLYLDTFLKDKTSSTGLWNDNQAGLFADRDTGSIMAGLRKGKSLVVGDDKSAFYAAEKPLVREVAAPGLINGDAEGRPDGAADDVICWDNLHWWGADAPGRFMISTPGAFHAAHVHWRWGEALQSWAGRALSNSWRRFQPGHPLVDPTIALQTIRVAVTKYRRSQDPRHTPIRDLTRPQWDALFHNAADAPPPEKIQDGGDLVLWYSSEVHRGILPVFPTGTVFIHGIFFAHEAEQSGPAFGPRTPLYWPRRPSDIDKAARWFRAASPG
jgi:hypothetical protein